MSKSANTESNEVTKIKLLLGTKLRVPVNFFLVTEVSVTMITSKVNHLDKYFSETLM